jgi:uncharacterized BrkB/YihY/UPF0761 family membrane protein
MNIFNHKKLWKNKVGSTYWYIYTLAFLLVMGVLYIIFNQTLQVYLYPTTLYLTGGNTAEPDRWIGFWEMTPYIIVLIGIVFLFFKLTQRDTTTGE